jgi:drug/metabolite transporter (DMT)-like permease
VGGVLLIAGGPQLLATLRGSAGGDVAARARVRAGVGWGVATGLLIASYTLVDGYAVKVALLSPILLDYLGNALRVPIMLPAALADRAGFMRDCRAQWKPALVLALISPVAYVLVLYAVQLAPLSRVAPAREVSMLVAALLGGHLLGEGERGWRLAGAALMAGGVVLLSW